MTISGCVTCRLRFNKKGPSPVFGIRRRMSSIKPSLPLSLRMLVKVVRWRVVSSKLEHDWCEMWLKVILTTEGITRQTHGPLSDNCHIWDQFSIQNTTVTQLSITKAPLENISKKYLYLYWMNIHDVSTLDTIFILSFSLNSWTTMKFIVLLNLNWLLNFHLHLH